MIAGAQNSAVATSRSALRIALAAAAGTAAGLAAGFRPPPWSASLALVVGLVATAAARPQAALFALMAVLFLAPFAVSPVRLLVQPPIFELGLAALLAASAVRLRSVDFLRARWSFTHWLVTAFLAASMVATLLGLSRRWDLQSAQLAGKLAMGILAFYVAAAWSRDARFVRRFALVVVLAGGLESVLAGLIYALGESAFPVFNWLAQVGYPDPDAALRFLPDRETVRAVGTNVDPNVLGAGLAVAFVIALGSSLTARGGRRAGWIVATLLIVPGLVLSMSRGSWLAAAAGVIVLVALRKPLAAAGLALAAIGLILSPATPPPLEHLRSGLLAREPSAVLRLREFEVAGRIVAEAPVFGAGIVAGPFGGSELEVSNAALWVAERAGLVGAIAFVAAVIGAVATGLRGAASGAHTGVFVAALIAAVASGLVDHHYASLPHMTAFFWILVGLVVGSAEAGHVPDRL